jgi:hypothetical protein
LSSIDDHNYLGVKASKEVDFLAERIDNVRDIEVLRREPGLLDRLLLPADTISDAHPSSRGKKCPFPTLHLLSQLASTAA